MSRAIFVAASVPMRHPELSPGNPFSGFWTEATGPVALALQGTKKAPQGAQNLSRGVVLSFSRAREAVS